MDALNSLIGRLARRLRKLLEALERHCERRKRGVLVFPPLDY